MGSSSSKIKRGARSKTITKPNREGENGDRFIASRNVDLMLAIALGRIPKLPVCKHQRATHAAGTAVAGVAVHVARAQTIALYDLTDIWCGEVYLESTFTEGKVMEHITFMDLLLQMMKCLGLQDGRTGGHILNEILVRLPRRSLRQYWENAALTYKTLTDVRHDVNQLRLTTKQLTDEERSEQIRLLLEKIVPCLREIRMRFRQMTDCLDGVAERIRTDWNEDATELSRQCVDSVAI